MLTITPYRRGELSTNLNSVFDSLMNDFFANTLETSFLENGKKAGYPRVDISESKDSWLVEATVPGLTKDDVTVEIYHTEGRDYLAIKSERATTTEDKDRNWHRKEIHRSSFCRNLVLPENANLDNIEAGVENGLLNIVIHKKQRDASPKIKQISVK